MNSKKTIKIKKLSPDLLKYATDIKFSRIDLYVVNRYAAVELRKTVTLTEQTHIRKLHNFAINNSLQLCDPNSVFYNFSSESANFAFI